MWMASLSCCLCALKLGVSGTWLGLVGPGSCGPGPPSLAAQIPPDLTRCCSKVLHGWGLSFRLRVRDNTRLDEMLLEDAAGVRSMD
jgi:hypothetical protein